MNELSMQKKQQHHLTLTVSEKMMGNLGGGVDADEWEEPNYNFVYFSRLRPDTRHNLAVLEIEPVPYLKRAKKKTYENKLCAFSVGNTPIFFDFSISPTYIFLILPTLNDGLL